MGTKTLMIPCDNLDKSKHEQICVIFKSLEQQNIILGFRVGQYLQ